MRRLEDALRSLKKHLAVALPEYEVRLWDEGAMAHRPFARVGLVGDTLMGGHSLKIAMTQAMSAYIYPPVEETAERSLVTALSVEERLGEAFVFGLTPFRVPMYSYVGVDAENGSEERRATDYMRVEDCAVRRFQETDDPSHFTVVCDVRLTWARETARAQAMRQGNVVESVRTSMVVPGAQQSVRVTGLQNPPPRFGGPRVETE